MCGIVSGIAQRPVAPILLEGLKRLEYRGYDSAGMAVISPLEELCYQKEQGKVARLEEILDSQPLIGSIGIAHTRWATHGKPSRENAHPHVSAPIAVVHNGIIENHAELRAQLKEQGYTFVSETDTEVVAHSIHAHMQQGMDLLQALKKTIEVLEGAYALAVVCEAEPHRLVGARKGSPLVIGVGIGEMYLASDPLALRQVTDQFIYLEEGDVVELNLEQYTIWDNDDQEVKRQLEKISDQVSSADKGEYKHYMLKEIFEQPKVLLDTIQGRVSGNRVLMDSFGPTASDVFEQLQAIQILACGTSYHAGMVAKYWFEEYLRIPCFVEVASEYRYRETIVPENTLLLTISQSGETADTLAALRQSKEQFLSTMSICNVAQSSLVRESELVMLTHAGAEVGVASTKAFTTQLAALLIVMLAIGCKRETIDVDTEKNICEQLLHVPSIVQTCLTLEPQIKRFSEQLIDKHHCLFLGRGSMYPVAMEGALKLKEISYIHAESYPAGELKHGPLALVDEDMPIIAVAPNNDLLEKLKSNLEEVHARGGELFIFADEAFDKSDAPGVHTITMPSTTHLLEPIVYTIPLQLLSYYVAVFKGTDVDQPRNLAKSVTVE